MGDKILKKLTILLTALSCLLIAKPQPQSSKQPVAVKNPVMVKKPAAPHLSELAWVDEQIEAIKPPRKGVSYRAIARLKDPFVFLEKNKTKKKEKKQSRSTPPQVVPKSTTADSTKAKKPKKKSKKGLKLQAVLNNSALINGRWYRLGDKVGSYRIVKITLTEVTLKKEGRKPIVLTTYTNKLKPKAQKETKTKK